MQIQHYQRPGGTAGSVRGKPNPRWITKISYWWGHDGIAISSFRVNRLSDLATGRMEPFDPGSVAAYPIFKNPQSSLRPGVMLCRLGFPFHSVHATYDQPSQRFILPPSALPMPVFPNEGMHTRVAMVADAASGTQAKFLETSSPGLRGQSGGPIFDRDGHIWGIQSRTTSFDLGFSPQVGSSSGNVVEHQFLNVGLGTHVEEVVKFLAAEGVSCALSD